MAGSIVGLLEGSMGRSRLLAAVVAIASWSCAEQIETNYEPRTALQPESASAHRAAQFYDQDIVRIFDAGGRIIGNPMPTEMSSPHMATSTRGRWSKLRRGVERISSERRKMFMRSSCALARPGWTHRARRAASLPVGPIEHPPTAPRH